MPKGEIIHDRLAEVSPRQQLGLVVDTVQDPYDRTATISVARATRDDPLAGMYARGQIDMAQLQAGRIWQRHWEDAAIGAIKAMQLKDPVDGRGPTPAPFSDRQRKAMEQLQNASVVLGTDGDCVVRLVLADRMYLQDIAKRFGKSSKTIGRIFRGGLERLARLWRLIS